MHRFIQEMHVAGLAGRDVMTVGESWSATARTALDDCVRDRRELGMVFGFNHIQAAWDPAKGRFGANLFDLRRHKTILADWQYALAEDRSDPEGIFEWYRRLISLRRDDPLVWDGGFEMLLQGHPSVMAYLRIMDRRRLLDLGSFPGEHVSLTAADLHAGSWRPLLANVKDAPQPGEDMRLPAWFAGVWLDEGR